MSVQGGAASGAFKVNSLRNLDTADPVAGRIVWDAPRSLWNMGMLAGALILGPLTFTWGALAAFLALSGFSCVSVTPLASIAGLFIAASNARFGLSAR